MKTKMNVKEVSEKDFNLLLDTKLDVLWEQQKGEPYFYLAHKEKIVKIFAVLSENECKSGILYKSFTFVEDECVGFIPMDVLSKGNDAIANYVMKYKINYLFDFDDEN